MMNQQMDFHSGYLAALEEVHRRLTSGDGRTEAYEDTVDFVRKELGK